ncbi:MAG: hypothetical protein ACFFAU_10575 [Candidatus Hodarchaeota archaeon]
MPKTKEPIFVSSKVWEVLLEIEALRTKEQKLVRNLFNELKEPSTRRIHTHVFEQALQSDSAFPSMSKKELDKWVYENISTVFITLIEQGIITVEEEEPSKARKWFTHGIKKIKEKIDESISGESENKEENSE